MTNEKPSFGQEDYWNERAKSKIFYKNEYFYTVTSLPFYIKRRELLLCHLEKEISLLNNENKNISILDFGCGDGYYSLSLKKKFPYTDVKGCDLSESMIESAKINSKESGFTINYLVANSVIPFQEKFDIIIIIAVLAHVLEDSLLVTIVTDISNHLRTGGSVIIFEATANIPRKGTTWSRRIPGFYENLFSRQGFSLKEHTLVSFPFFSRMDWFISKIIRLVLSIASKFLSEKSHIQEKITVVRSNLNKIFIYLLLSEILISVSKFLDPFFSASEGNSFMIFRKNS